MSLDSKTYGFGIGELAHQQIAARLNIPFRYYQKMQSEAPELLDRNVNTWFGKNPERRMIRVLDGKVDDVVQAGFVVSNSEVGLGSLRVEPLVFS